MPDRSGLLSPLRGYATWGVFSLRADARSYMLPRLRRCKCRDYFLPGNCLLARARRQFKNRTMTRILLTICVLALFLCDCTQGAPPEAALPAKHKPFLKTHCFDCHDSETQEGKVDLEQLPLGITTLEQAELWQKVLNALNAGEMPPEDSPQPGNTQKADFLDDLAQTMVAARKVLSDSGGKITMRRLNRREYRNTIEHLLGAQVDISSLPADGGSGSFDTVGSSQFISSDQIEQYLKLGRSAIDEAFERQTALQQESRTFRVEPETIVNVQSRKNMAKQEETYKRYLLWKAEVDKVALLPENEKVLAQLREKYKLDNLTDSIRLYQNANLLKGTPDATKFGFRDANAASFSYQGGYGRTHAYMKHYLELPHSDRGTYLKLAWAIQRIDVTPKPENVPPGTYKLRIRAGAVKGSDPSRHFIEVGHPQRLTGVRAGFANKPLASLQVMGTEDSPEIIETTLVIGSKTQREFGIQERRPEGNQKTLSREFFAHKRKNGYGTPPAIWVDWIELVGPIKDVELVQSKVHRVEPEKTINPANEKQIEQIEDSYTRFTRWQKVVDKAAKSPANQAIIAKIRKTERLIDHPTRFYAYADRLKGTPNPKEFGFRDSQKAASANPQQDRADLAYHKHYAALPHRDQGVYLKLAHGTGRVIVSPKELPPGNYVMRVRVGAAEGSPASRHFIQVGHPQRQIASRNWGLEGRAISSHQVTGTIENPQTIEIPLEVGSNATPEFAIQEKQPNTGNLKELWDAHNKLKKENGYGHPPAIWIDWVELEGPHNASNPKSWKQRREVEEHANAKINGTYKGYHVGGNEKANRFLETGQPPDGIVDEQEAKFRIRAFEQNGPTYRRYLKDPLTQTGSYLTISNLNKEEYIALPPERASRWRGTKHVVESVPPGDYKLRFRIGAVKGTPAERHFVDLGIVPKKNQFNHLRTFQISATTDAPQTIEVPVTLTVDGPRKFALREKRDPKEDVKRYRAARAKTGVGPLPALWIDWVEWEGPMPEPASRSRAPLQTILAKYGGGSAGEPTLGQGANHDMQRGRSILSEFAVAAFRGAKPDPDFIEKLLAIYEGRRKAGDSFENAIRLPLSIILASPGFLYLNEPGDVNERRQLTDRELAVRMAYFLWSAPPDQQLLDLATQQKLSQPEILRQQVDRLIADSRSDEFVSGFLHQWLDMERLDFFQFDTTLHRDFDESTRSAARQEVYHSFAHLLRANGNPKRERGTESGHGRLSKLLKSDYVFVNGLLANYYGIDGVTGDQFQKVTLPADSPRGGLLGMAAIHAMGSDGIESSPVERGAWVLRHLLNDPPPPAPPNVPQLSRLADKPLSTRQKLAAHQEEAQCASCHRKIDPIGFGLEHFNAAGKWRAEEHQFTKNRKGKLQRSKTGTPIDTSGKFHNGPAFADYHELRELIANQEEDFARGFTEHLIEYALGRPFGFTDEDHANEIVGFAKSKQFAVSEFVHALVQSSAFRTK